jgi:predicted regulator of Ras-like GTPase activity (Roadblock/LC7/MglB family)
MNNGATTMTPRKSAETNRVLDLPEAVKKSCVTKLKELREAVGGISTIGLVSPDGFEVAWISTATLPVSKISALASTLVAVAHSYTKEVGLSECRELIIDTDLGCSLLMDVTVDGRTYGLLIAAEDTALLGRVLSKARACAKELKDVIATR